LISLTGSFFRRGEERRKMGKEKDVKRRGAQDKNPPIRRGREKMENPLQFKVVAEEWVSINIQTFLTLVLHKGWASPMRRSFCDR